jgi:hypothetical protein
MPFLKKSVWRHLDRLIMISILSLPPYFPPAPDNPVLPNNATGKGHHCPAVERIGKSKKFHPGRSYPGLISPMLPKEP